MTARLASRPTSLLVFIVAAAAALTTGVRPAPAAGPPVVVGQVVVLPGDAGTASADGRLQDVPALTAQVIAALGDHFETIVFWSGFPDPSGPANHTLVKNGVRGLGLPPVDRTAEFGSRGTLESVIQMSDHLVVDPDPTLWGERHGLLEVLGEEHGHRWLAFFLVRDPRTGQLSDMLLGRQCAHYNTLFDSDGSVMDGVTWVEVRPGLFTNHFVPRGYSSLDLYGMGLLAPDEVPPLFVIEPDRPGRQARRHCGLDFELHDQLGREGSHVTGTRLELGVEDVAAANGDRLPRAFERAPAQDYRREVHVLVTAAGQGPGHPAVQPLVRRLDQVRLRWEQWVRVATRRRLNVCTRPAADCGDPRSDVAAVELRAPGVPPSAGRTSTVVITIENTGDRPTSEVHATAELALPAGPLRQSRVLGSLPVGATHRLELPVDLSHVPCGFDIAVTASTQSEHHHHRKVVSALHGVEVRHREGFEGPSSDWRVNPDGTDDSRGAVWERGRPEATALEGRPVQPAGAASGEAAWVTGVAAVPAPAPAAGGRAPHVHGGRTTLESPRFAARELRRPSLRYRVSFAGVRAAALSPDLAESAVVPSVTGSLTVLARAIDEAGAPGPWLEVDRLDNTVTSGWVSRTAALPPALTPAAQLQLRLIAEDVEPSGWGAVEAAIDEVEITSDLPACDAPPPPPPAAGGCGVAGAGATAPPVPLMVMGAVFLVITAAARRRRPAALGAAAAAVLAAALAAGCGDGDPGWVMVDAGADRPGRAEGGAPAPALGDGPDGGVTPPALATSGTRLRAIHLTTPDGLDHFDGWFDPQLGQRCGLREIEGRIRCAPAARPTTLHADAECREPLVAVDAGGTCATGFVIRPAEEGSHLHRLAAPRPYTTWYELSCAPDGARRCEPRLAAGAGRAFMPHGDRVPGADLVTLERNERVPAGSSPRLSYIEAKMTDGSRAIASVYDEEMHGNCQVRLATDGTYRCMPTGSLIFPEEFADAGCTRNTFSILYLSGTPSPPERVVGARMQVGACRQAEERVRAESVVAGPTIYEKRNGVCQAKPARAGATYYVVGETIPPAQFVEFTPTLGGRPGARLRPRWFAGEGGVFQPAAMALGSAFRFLDGVTGEPCEFLPTSDRVARCLPSYGGAAPSAFADPACTQPAMAWQRTACATSPLQVSFVPGPWCAPAARVMAAREPIPVAYRRTPAGTCEEIPGSRSAVYRRLELAPATSFAPATETMR